MKTHHTSLCIFLFLSLFIFTINNKVTAAPGDSCSNPYVLTLDSTMTNLPLRDSIVWFKFTAAGSNVSFNATDSLDGVSGKIESFTLYSGSCGVLVSLISAYPVEDSTITLSYNALSFGNTYYIEAIADKHNLHSLFKVLVQSNTNTCPALNGCNIVSNGDFESKNKCPLGYSNVNVFSSDVCCWYSPDAYTPDYFNSCATPVSGVSVPDNNFGCTAAHSLDGYVGIDLNVPVTTRNRNCNSEYIQENLASPYMTAGVSYAVSYWVQLSTGSDYSVDEKSMGLFISVDQPQSIGSICANLLDPDPGSNYLGIISPTDPRVISAYSSSTSLSSAGSWVNITGTYGPASGNERWITLGNFNTATTLTAATPSCYYSTNAAASSAYYYIDDVSITPILNVTVNPNPAIICTNSGSSVSLSATTSGGTSPYTYTWVPVTGLSNPNIANPIATPTSTITYTVTSTDAHGCSGTASVTVNVDNFKVIQPIGSYSVCPGSCATLSVLALGGTSPYTYSWSPGTWLTSTTTSNPEVCPPSNATPGTYTYTVAVADAHGCNGIATFSVVVLPAPPAPAISGLKFACGSPPYTYTVTNSVVGANYTWSVTNTSTNTITSPGTTATASLTTLPATITCTATYTGSGDGCSSTGTFTVYPCCATGTFAQTITNEDALTAGTSFTNESILINGTFTVDANTSFVGCDVQFTPNSSIIIESGSSLTINSSLSECSHLHAGCDAMWSGIFINSGGSLLADGSLNEGGGVLIEDAESAVVVNPSASPGIYALNEVIFNKDYQGIVIDPTSAIYSGSATNCIFTCRNLSSIACPNWYADWQTGSATTISLSPYSGDITYSGIYMNTVYEYSNFTKCYFDNLEYGVYATRSSVGVYGNTFQNIATPNGSYTGVYALNCWDCFYSTSKYSVTVGGSVAWQWNTFTNCNIGVHAAYMDYITVDNNTFDNTGYAPFEYAVDQGERRLFGSGAGTISIRSNTINNAIVGIRAISNLNIQAAIDCNIISDPSCTSFNYTGITVSEINAPRAAIYDIAKDEITVPNDGILVNNTYGTSVVTDNVYLGYGTVCPEPKGHGIQINGSTDCGIGCGTLVESSPSLSSNYYTAMEESQSPSTLIDGNNTENTYQHIQFDGGNSTNSNAYLNGLHTGYTGIFTTNAALNGLGIGEGVKEAYNGFSGTITCQFLAPSRVKYYCGVDCPSTCLTSSFQLEPGAAWLYYPLCIVEDTDCATSLKMSKLNSIIVDGDSLMSLFVDSVTATPNKVIPDSTVIAYMENVALNHDTFPELQDTGMPQAKEGVLRVLWDNPSLLSSYSILYHFNDSMRSAPMGEIMAIDTDIWSADSIAGYTALLTSLNAITPVNNLEANLQTAAWGYLTYLINDTLTPAQVSTVRTLANKCPGWDGDAVYQARALLSIYDSAGTVYSDSCSLSGHRPEKGNNLKSYKTIIGSLFNLYPNPSNGGFTLAYQLQQGQTGEFIMYDMLGKKIASYPLNPNEEKMSINEASLDNGVYLYSIIVNNSIVKQDKLVIIK